jgi:2-dehydropantoate 2-reductase
MHQDRGLSGESRRFRKWLKDMGKRLQAGKVERPSILVVGCGALGTACLFHLRKIAQVFGYDCDRARSEELSRAGAGFLGAGRVRPVVFNVAATMECYRGKVFDGVIFATKCRGLRPAVRVFSASGRATRVLFLQNGGDDLLWAKSLLRGSRICRGVTTMAVSLQERSRVRLYTAGETFLGSIDRQREGAQWFAHVFAAAGLNVHLVKNIAGAVWAKLIFNAVMNPLPVLCSQSYAVLHRDRLLYALARDAIREGVAVARKAKICLAFDPLAKLRAVREGRLNTDNYFGSMYADATMGRATEIEELTGLLVRQAKRLGVPVPRLDTIYALTRARLEKKDG